MEKGDSTHMKNYKHAYDHNGVVGLKIKKLPYTDPPPKCERNGKKCGHCRPCTGFGGGYFCHYSLDTDRLKGRVEGDICPYYTDKRCFTTDNFKVIRDKTMPVPREISARIKYIRKQRGEIQADLAKAIGTVPNRISQWETGSKKPSAGNIIKLCQHYNVSADWLLGLSDYQSIGGKS